MLFIYHLSIFKHNESKISKQTKMFFTLHSLLPTPSTFLRTKTPPNPNLPFFPISSSSHPNPPPSQPPKPPPTTKKAAPLPKKTAGGAKPRRGRRSEAAAVEDYVRDTLHRTLDAIKDGKGEVLEEEEEEEAEAEQVEGEGRGGVVEEDDPDWPVDAEVGWGVRASEYFEKHPIRNVVEGGVEIDWEGELDDAWVKEINCLEWESFAFHPSPLIVLAFERYNRLHLLSIRFNF